MTEKTRFRCNKCGNEDLYSRPIDIIRKRKTLDCYKCGKGNNKEFSKSKFLDFMKENDFDLIGTYKNSKTDVEFLHLKCGKITKVSPIRYNINKENCQYCRMSVGEKVFADKLYSKNIPFEYQKTFKDLKSKKSLFFDFYIIEKIYLLK